jgi:hypothetical protein
VIALHEAALHHVEDTAGGADDDVDASVLEDTNVFLNDSAADAGMDLDALVLANGVNDVGDLHGQLASWRDNERLAVSAVGVDALQDTDREGSCFTGSRLGL